MVRNPKMDISCLFITKHISKAIFNCVESVSISVGLLHSSAVSRLSVMGFQKSWTFLKTSANFRNILFYGQTPTNGYFMSFYYETYFKLYFQLKFIFIISLPTETAVTKHLLILTKPYINIPKP